MQPASRHRRRRFVTAVLDVETSQILDVFEGHDARHLRAWMAQMPPAWLDQIKVVSVDPHERYRSVLTNPHPDTRAVSPLADTLMVVDPFHIVRLANTASRRVVPGYSARPSSAVAGKATRSTTSANCS